MTSPPIYMDNQATTRVDPRVVEAMLPYLTEVYGNAGSVNHVYGWDARDAVDQAREKIAAAIGAHAKEIVFTSGATESNNLAIRGVAERKRRQGNHLVTVATEHKSVIEPMTRLGRRGYEVTFLSVTPHGDPRAGIVDVNRLAEALRDETFVVSIMLANNEIGVLQPLAEIGDLCKERDVLLHCDATQAVGKIPVDVEALQIDLMSFSSHKIYGPKGVGALYVRRRNPHVRLDSQILGGGHERGFRSGTLNVPGIVGFSRGLELCLRELPHENRRLAQLRDRLFKDINHSLDQVTLLGPALHLPELRLPGNLNLAFAMVDGEAMLMSMGNLAVSSGAACTSADPKPSHVLQALGVPETSIRSSIRFGLGRFNTEKEVDFSVNAVVEVVRRLRSMSSLAQQG